MPYCPKCDMEFVEGIKICSDCGGPLVESKEVADAMKQKEKEELEKKYKELFAEKNFGFKRLMKAFPDMTSREQNESLEKYKKYFNIRKPDHKKDE